MQHDSENLGKQKQFRLYSKSTDGKSLTDRFLARGNPFFPKTVERLCRQFFFPISFLRNESSKIGFTVGIKGTGITKTFSGKPNVDTPRRNRTYTNHVKNLFEAAFLGMPIRWGCV